MIKGFDKFNISDDIKRALQDLGYNKPTEVQDKVIGEALLNKDLLVRSQTGTGKTAAFVIPICEKINWQENHPECLILTPTRELALQISEDVKNIGRFKRIKGVPIYGKAPFKEQLNELKGKTHVVIGTPGRVLDHIDRKSFNTDKIKYLIIDEADEMLNMGFIRQVEAVFRRLPKKRVTMLFSATFPKEILDLGKKYMYKPVKIEIDSDNLEADNISHYLYRVNGNDKLEYLNKLMIKEKPKCAVLFCRTKENVDLAFDYLNKLNYSVIKIHGGMLQKDRIEAMNKFKKGEYRYLIATDVASRGIDVLGITHVINIDIPVEKEAYVHRIGRTARNGNKGKAISFATPYEDKYLNAIFEYINKKIEESPLSDLDINEAEKEKALKILTSKGEIKESKGKIINKNIMKLYLNGGKKKKIRAVDLVGAISNIENINASDIGIIDIQDLGSYVEILNGKGKIVLNALKNKKIKGKNLKVEIARK